MFLLLTVSILMLIFIISLLCHCFMLFHLNSHFPWYWCGHSIEGCRQATCNKPTKRMRSLSFSVEISKMNNAHNLNILCVSRTRSKLDLLCKIILLYIRIVFLAWLFFTLSLCLRLFVHIVPVERCQLAFVLCAIVYTVKIIEHVQTKRLSDSMWPYSFNAFDYFVVFCFCYAVVVHLHIYSRFFCRRSRILWVDGVQVAWKLFST